jgi:hypothetical protein
VQWLLAEAAAGAAHEEPRPLGLSEGRPGHLRLSTEVGRGVCLRTGRREGSEVAQPP